MYDYLIKNGKIVDGSGMPWFMGDVAVKGDRIAFIGKISQDDEAEAVAAGCRVIDAAGKVVAPGFIDSHTHLDLAPFEFNGSEDQRSVRRLRQGITTQITGCCGISPAPVT